MCESIHGEGHETSLSFAYLPVAQTEQQTGPRTQGHLFSLYDHVAVKAGVKVQAFNGALFVYMQNMLQQDNRPRRFQTLT